MKVKLISITPNAEKIIEYAGRICYDSHDKITDDSCVKFIKALVKRGHDSVLEHASATFHISEVSRNFSHQMVRHRLMSFSQKSQRYCVEDQFDYIIPENISEENKSLYNKAVANSRNVYKLLLQSGMKPEDARNILPSACHTELICTANFREYRHIFNLRINDKAQEEIRKVCEYMLGILYAECPSVFEDLYLKAGHNENS